MQDQTNQRRGTTRRRASAALLTATGLLTGCSNAQMGLPGANLGQQSDSAEQSAGSPDAGGAHLPAGLSAKLAGLSRAHADKPKDQAIALAYARGLRSGGKQKQALAVLDQASDGSADNRQFLVEHGLIALELGEADKARTLLMRTEPAKSKDWRVLSGLGVAHASLGQQSEAQKYFGHALAIAPNNPIVLNNLAMSYMLGRKIDQAEATLRQAASGGEAKSRVAQNLALAVALKQNVTSADEQDANVAEVNPAAIRPVRTPPAALGYPPSLQATSTKAPHVQEVSVQIPAQPVSGASPAKARALPLEGMGFTPLQ